MPVLLPTLKRAGVLLLTTAALYATPAAPAYGAYGAYGAAADEPGWTAEPVAGSGAARPYFYLAGDAGTVLEDRLALANTSDRAHTVTLRGADAYNTADGAFAVRPGRPPVTSGADTAEGPGAGAWISFGAGATVTIPPRTRAVVPFTVTVPPSSPPGDHPAAVVATEAGREVGVRVHLRVSGPTLAALTVEDVAVHGRGAAARVAYTLVNRGNVALAPELAVRAEGTFGRERAGAPRPLPVELLPGQRVRLTEPWPAAPALDRVAFTLTVTAPGAAPATGSAAAWFTPRPGAAWAGAGLLLLGGGAAAALFLVRRRRLRGGGVPGPGPGDGERPDPGSEAAADHELTGAAR
ncbi:hypothetical protein [Streptomyces sp. NPDC046685]|uniref:COG1470 family protein n=1 Tax=Streptomyces sp. NPDC046685 TaxID=3157202 RepID=UPI0033D2C9BA